MKLLNKLITKTAIYKHLKDLYERAIQDVETMQKDLKSQEISLNEWSQIVDVRTKERDKLKTVLRKILTRVRKLDKKDENVKEIKRLIKEVL